MAQPREQCQAGKKQQVHTDNGQPEQRLIADEEQQRQSQGSATETEAGAHKTCPHKQQGNGDGLIQ